MERVIIDTNPLIKIERGHIDPARLDGYQINVAAITAAELLVGVHLATTKKSAAARRQNIKELLDGVPVYTYDEVTAEVHAELLAYCRRTGEPRGAHDLIIAATACSLHMPVLTFDRAAAFGVLPNVQVIELKI